MICRPDEFRESKYPLFPENEADRGFCQSISREGLAVLVLIVAFILMMVYGIYLGNVFETYHNGASL